jgi:uncharacterized membrane protein
MSFIQNLTPSMTKEKIELSPSTQRTRLDSVDLLRGLVMIIMALDHVRYPYFTNSTIWPEDITQTYAALFFTRWMTHFCAPLFFLLAGTGAYLSFAQGKTSKEISRFFWTRGLWLVLLELTIIGFAWSFKFGWAFGGVIWALGWSMVIMSVLVRLPLKWIATIGIGMIALHNLADGISPDMFEKFSWLWMILHSGGMIKIESLGFGFPILYSLIPWSGVMAAGYALGHILTREKERRRKWLLRLGAIMTLAFVLLRFTNLYGNPWPFAAQETMEKSIIAFFNVAKYPASLQFLLMTLGPALILLAWFDRFNFRSRRSWLGKKILVFGRVPLFYYLLHLFTIHLLAIAVGLIYQQPIAWLWGQALPLNRPAPPEYGHGLPFIYFMTLFVVALLYFPCNWFAKLKQRRKDWWLRYL